MNNTSNLRRIQNEVKQMRQSSSEYEKMFQVKMIEDNMYHWEAILHGPEDSLYENYKFKLDIVLPENYPFSPIKIKFLTRIKHINVNSDGDICLDILKTNWTPSQNIQTIILSIRLLLSNPNPDDPFNSELAEVFRKDQFKYMAVVKDYCKKHAIKN